MTLEKMYNDFFRRLQQNEVGNDLASVNVNVALLDASHTPDVANNASWADISTNEITNTTASDTGYTAGGQTLSNVTITADATSRNVDFDADNVEWTSSTIDAGYAVVYHAAPSTDADKDLIMLVDFEGEQSSQDASFTIEWDSAGIYRVDTNP